MESEIRPDSVKYYVEWKFSKGGWGAPSEVLISKVCPEGGVFSGEEVVEIVDDWEVDQEFTYSDSLEVGRREDIRKMALVKDEVQGIDRVLNPVDDIPGLTLTGFLPGISLGGNMKHKRVPEDRVLTDYQQECVGQFRWPHGSRDEVLDSLRAHRKAYDDNVHLVSLDEIAFKKAHLWTVEHLGIVEVNAHFTREDILERIAQVPSQSGPGPRFKKYGKTNIEVIEMLGAGIIVDSVIKILEDLTSGRIDIFNGIFVKMEPHTWKKVMAKKWRLIHNFDLDVQVVFRLLFDPFTKNDILNCQAGITNMGHALDVTGSSGWVLKRLVESNEAESDDISGYDNSYGSLHIESEQQLYLDRAWNEDQEEEMIWRTMARNLFQSIEFQSYMVIPGGDVYFISSFWKWPSGIYITSNGNTSERIKVWAYTWFRALMIPPKGGQKACGDDSLELQAPRSEVYMNELGFVMKKGKKNEFIGYEWKVESVDGTLKCLPKKVVSAPRTIFRLCQKSSTDLLVDLQNIIVLWCWDDALIPELLAMAEWTTLSREKVLRMLEVARQRH
jgi:hypothetical protein